MIAEGAGALAVAAALVGRVDGARKVVCIVSGGNIDPAVLSRILAGEQPVNVDAVRARFSSLQNGLRVLRRARRHAGARTRSGEAIANALREASGNLGAPYATGPRGRGDPRAARRTTRRGFLGCTPDEISFGMNMTTLDFAISRAAGARLRSRRRDR